MTSTVIVCHKSFMSGLTLTYDLMDNFCPYFQRETKQEKPIKNKVHFKSVQLDYLHNSKLQFYFSI